MRQWVNSERTVLIRGRGDKFEVATRPDTDAIWSPPIPVLLEPDPNCGFCHGRPVGDAATWLDGKPRPPAACPRCGGTFQ